LTNSIDKAIGARIRKFRETLTLTAKQLAEMLGISEQEMLDYEDGSERVDPAQCLKIASALGVTPAEILCEDSHRG